MSKIELDESKKAIAQIYDRRQDSYDQGGADNWHFQLACCLVECANLKSGQKVLDLATGTGMVAIEAAKQVGLSGQVTGVDISSGLLAVAQKKIDKAELNNIIQLKLADIEKLVYPASSYDCVFCCSALPLLTDVPADLRLWHSFLTPKGKLGLCVFAETAFTAGVVLQKVARRYSVKIIMSDLTGTEEKCHSLLEAAGYKNIEITTEQYGSYIDLKSTADKTWDISLEHPHCYPLLELNPEQLAQAKAEYIAELDSLVTEQGIWNDVTTFFAIAEK